jgi:hypothetical protein
MFALVTALLLAQTYPPFSGGPTINGIDPAGNAHPFAVNQGGALSASGSLPSYYTRLSYTNTKSSYSATPMSLVGDAGAAIVTANYTVSTVSCYPVMPNGTLGTRVDSVVESAPRMIAAADFNGDGITDIAVTNRSPLVGVYFGDGGCGFANGTATILDAGTITAAQGIVAAQFGSSGTYSIAIGDRSSWGIDVFIGQGDGGFLPGVAYDAGGGGMSQLALVDFNQDATLDLVAPGSSTVGTVSLLEGHSNGTFSNVATYTTQCDSTDAVTVGAGSVGQLSPNPPAIVDLNSDGVVDVVVTCGSSTAQRAGIEVFFGQPSASGVGYALNTPSSYFPFASTSNGVCQGAVVGDFNGDGFQDVAAACSASSSNYSGVLIATGDGRGHLSPLPLLSSNLQNVSGESVIYLNAADLNGDGYLDFIVPVFGNFTGQPNLLTWLSQAPVSIAPSLGAAWQVAPVPGSGLGVSQGPAAISTINAQSKYGTYLGTIPSRRNITVQTQYDSTPIWVGGPNVCAAPGYGFSSSDAGFTDGGACQVGIEVQPGQTISIDLNNNPAVLGASLGGYASNGLFAVKASGAQDGTPDGGWTVIMELP